LHKKISYPTPSRRNFLKSASFGALLFTQRSLFAEQLVLTPAQTIGPYYPDKMPLDLDNDLIRINDNLTPATGQVTWLNGRILGSNGTPLRNALIEIWQADNNGAYIHSRSPIANRDANFQGYGKFLTGSTGEYVFRTVKPGLYPGRTRHIHMQVTAANGTKLVSQVYVKGDALNANDGVLNGIRDTAQRDSVIVPWEPIAYSLAGEFSAKWDIVMGFTPSDPVGSKPSILAQNGVVNGAGYQAGVTAGAWLSIFGDNLAPGSRMWNASTDVVSGKLPTSLDGVSVSISGKPAAVYYVSPNQLNVQAPSDDSAGSVQVTVTNANGTSDPVTANLSTYLPGLFLLPRNYVAAVHADGSYIGPAGLFDAVPTTAAKSGESISLFGTGFGPTNPRVAAGELFQGAAQLTAAVEVRIGSTNAEVTFAGLSSAGLYQLNIVVPNLPDGDHDVVAKIGGARTQSLARLRVVR
jgi:protocatechuate 3,4-dioxygenase beta subunit